MWACHISTGRKQPVGPTKIYSGESRSLNSTKTHGETGHFQTTQRKGPPSVGKASKIHCIAAHNGINNRTHGVHLHNMIPHFVHNSQLHGCVAHLSRLVAKSGVSIFDIRSPPSPIKPLAPTIPRCPSDSEIDFSESTPTTVVDSILTCI